MLKVETIRQRVTGHRAKAVDLGKAAERAAVALIVRDSHDGAEFLAIRRAERTGDPWSGHMALPGGRSDPCDRDVFATATRETLEEVGIDLRASGKLIGHLDELQAVGHGQPLPLIISPLACELLEPVSLVLNRREVGDALWIPVATLLNPESQGSFHYERNDIHWEHPAFVYDGHTIWGLTYRILANLAALLA